MQRACYSVYEQVASLVYLIVSHTHASTAWNGWNLRALMVRSPKEFATAYASATIIDTLSPVEPAVAATHTVAQWLQRMLQRVL
jgi:hypothetical protein